MAGGILEHPELLFVGSVSWTCVLSNNLHNNWLVCEEKI